MLMISILKNSMLLFQGKAIAAGNVNEVWHKHSLLCHTHNSVYFLTCSGKMWRVHGER
jgi:hypothetical protein